MHEELGKGENWAASTHCIQEGILGRLGHHLLLGVLQEGLPEHACNFERAEVTPKLARRWSAMLQLCYCLTSPWPASGAERYTAPWNNAAIPWKPSPASSPSCAS